MTAWSFAVAFDLPVERVQKACVGLKPGGRGKKGAPTYRPAEILHALLDRKAGKKLSDERLRSETARADLLEVELAGVREQVVELDGVDRAWQRVGMAIRRQILTSHLSKAEQDTILRQLSELKPEDFIKDTEDNDAGDVVTAASPS